MKRRKSHPIINGHKQCLDCNQVKPLTDYRKSNNSKGGITPSCRVCLSEKLRNTRRANGMPPRKWTVYPIIDGIKKCYKCLNDYPIDQYNFKSGYIRHMCRACDIGTIEHRKAVYQRRYAKEKEIRSIRVAERRRDPEHRQKFLDWANKYNKKNHESGKWAEWYREQSKLLTDTYLLSVINQRSSKKGNVYISKADVSQEVFELLRTKIKLQRELRQLNSLNK